MGSAPAVDQRVFLVVVVHSVILLSPRRKGFERLGEGGELVLGIIVALRP